MNEQDVDSSLLARKIPYSVAERLGCYVYLYVNPVDDTIFYIGKGVGQRALSHLSSQAESRKVATIRELAFSGKEPRIEILAHGLDRETALMVEAAAIDVLGLDRLTNLVRGHGSGASGRLALEEVLARYGAREIQIVDPLILIRVNRLYKPTMDEQEVLEITRGIWKVGARRAGARLALAVFHGVVREVFEIHSWHQAGTTAYRSRMFPANACAGRWEFVGAVACEELRSKYRGGNVAAHLADKSRNPIAYAGGA